MTEADLPTSVVGTPCYRAPEMLQERVDTPRVRSWLTYFNPYSPSTWTIDAFSFGVLLFVSVVHELTRSDSMEEVADNFTLVRATVRQSAVPANATSILASEAGSSDS